MGIVDVAMNAHGIALQNRMGRPVLSSLHGVYSIGGLLGALTGGLAEARDLSPLVHFAIVAAVLGGAALAVSSWLLPASCDLAPKAAEGGWAKLPAERRVPLVLLGFVGLCGMAGEGAAGDWGAIYLRDDEVLCILDADVLADRDFVARNAERFRSPGVGGHMTYRKMSCLDGPTTAWAIRERVQRGGAEAGADQLRAFQLRRPPGCCLWVRTGTFHHVGGMDERYEGWGGEDNDFVCRFDIAAPFFNHDDWMLHMQHPPASLLRDDGELVNAHIPPLSWRPEGPIGQLDRFAAEPGPEAATGAASASAPAPASAPATEPATGS